MEGNWDSGKLSDLTEILMGQSPSGETCNSQHLGIPLLNGPTEFSSHHPIPVQFTIDPKKIAELDDILFCVRGSTTGRMNWSDQKYAIGRGIAAIRHKQGSEYKHFIRGLLEFKLPLLLTIATGSTFPNISKDQLLSLPCDIPPLSEQKAIAHILSSFDDKIELNRQMNETLEAMARAIFKSWFVDFDPVSAKRSGRQPAGMDTATADLFPDEFEESSLGLIPKGWELKSLDEIANFLNGLALQKYPPNSEEYLPVIKIAELRKGITEQSAKASIDIPSDYIVENGDILFSWSGSLVNCIWCGGKGALNQHLFKVTSTKYPKWFYYQWVNYHLPEFQFIAASKATTMGHIQRHHLKEAKVITPSFTLLSSMDKIMNPLFEQVINSNLESHTLATLRDTLLPKLMSGEIRVKEAEKIINDKL